MFILLNGLWSYTQLTPNVDSLLLELEKSKLDTNRVNLLNDIAYTYWYNQPQQCELYADSALRLSREFGFYNGYYDAITNLGSFHMLKGEYQEAFDLYQKSLDTAIVHKDSLGIAISYLNLGVVMDYSSRPGEALDYYMRSLELSKNDSANLCLLNLNIGSIFFDQELYSDASKYYEKALRISRAIGDKETECYALVSIGETFYETGQLEMAYHYYLRSRESASKTNNQSIYADTKILLGKYFVDHGKLDSGLMCFQGAIEIAEELESVEIFSRAYFEVGKYFEAKGQEREALEQFRKSLACAQQIKNYRKVHEASQAMATLYSKQNQFKKAYEMQLVSKMATDTLTVRRRAVDLGSLDYQYQLETQVLKNNQLKKEDTLKSEIIEAQQETISQQKKTLYFLIGGGVLLIGFFMVAYAALRNKRRVYAAQQQNEELMDLNQEIIRQKEVIDQQNLNLQQFAATTSHDLKTPIRGIIQLSEWLEKDHGDQLDGQAREYVNLIKTRGRKLHDLIDGMLKHAKSTSKDFTDKEEVNLSKMIEETVDLLVPPPNIEVVYEKELPSIKTSRVGLQQVLQNLLSNAIKYNDKARGLVEVKLVRRVNQYTIQVSDNGPGIAKEHHESVFALFKTLGKTDRNNNLGTGIGLANVRKIVEKMGGDITIDSNLGEGATFRFTLPVHS